jgi:GTP-binding protein
MQGVVEMHQPPLVGGRRIKLRSAHQGGSNPPIVVIHGNQLGKLPGSYKRYLENAFRKALGVRGTPIRFEFKTSENPYDDAAKGRRTTKPKGRKGRG